MFVLLFRALCRMVNGPQDHYVDLWLMEKNSLVILGPHYV